MTCFQMSKAENKICLPVIKSDETEISLGAMRLRRQEIFLAILGVVVVITCLGIGVGIG